MLLFKHTYQSDSSQAQDFVIPVFEPQKSTNNGKERQKERFTTLNLGHLF